MIEHREDLPLGAEAPQDLVRAHARVDQLDRDFLGEALIVAGGPIDHAHAATADLLDHPVRPEPGARCNGMGERDDGWSRQEVAGLLVRREERTDLVGEVGVARDKPCEERLAFGRLELQRIVEEDLHPAPGPSIDSGRSAGIRGPARIGRGVTG